MDEIDHRAIEPAHDQFTIISLVRGQDEPCRHRGLPKPFIARGHYRNRLRFEEIEAQSEINNCADDKWLIDLCSRDSRILLHEPRPIQGTLRAALPKIDAGAQPIEVVLARSKMLSTGKNAFA